MIRLLPFHPYVPVLKELGWRDNIAKNPESVDSAEAVAPEPSAIEAGVWVMLMWSGWA